MVLSHWKRGKSGERSWRGVQEPGHAGPQGYHEELNAVESQKGVKWGVRSDAIRPVLGKHSCCYVEVNCRKPSPCGETQ